MNFSPLVDVCHRCGQLAECPAVGQYPDEGSDQAQMVLCLECVALLLEAPDVFWRSMGRRHPPD